MKKVRLLFCMLSLLSVPCSMKANQDSYIIADGQTLDYCVKNTSSNYTVISSPILAVEGKELTIKTSRYTYWSSVVEGSG